MSEHAWSAKLYGLSAKHKIACAHIKITVERKLANLCAHELRIRNVATATSHIALLIERKTDKSPNVSVFWISLSLCVYMYSII